MHRRKSPAETAAGVSTGPVTGPPGSSAGIATLLLEHLVSLARSRQITTFTAETLTDNRAMLKVFADAGLPVQQHVADGVFRTTRHSALDEDLQTGIAGGEYLAAFEVDAIDEIGRQGWSVLIQGPAHHVSEAERESAERAGVEPWPAGSASCSCALSRTASPAAGSSPLAKEHLAGCR